MIICKYCQTQLPGRSLFCCQCGGKVHVPDETLVSTTSGPAIKSALMRKHQVIAQYAGPGSPRNGDSNNPAAAKMSVRVIWEEEEDDTWL